MDKCKFSVKYFDYEKNEPQNFVCDEPSLSSGYCMFHDEKYDDDEDRFKRLSKKIEDLSKNEPLFCIGYHISNFDIKKSLSGSIYFTRAIIKNGKFSSNSFQKADFSGATLHDVDFSGSKFEKSDFLSVNFLGKANFSQTSFENGVNFSESSFTDADFSESFVNKGNFIGTKIKFADFSNAKIQDCDFFGVLFEGESRFIGTEFTKTRFPSAKFKGKSIFTGAKFTKTNFPQCEFNAIDCDHVVFDVGVLQKSIFLGSVNFSSSKLYNVDFFKTIFQKNINFSETELNQVGFSESKFNGSSNFNKTNFNDVKFEKAEFKQEVDFSNSAFSDKTYFNSVSFKLPVKVLFYVKDLSKVSFMNTNISKIKLGEKVHWGGSDGFTIFDEEILEKNPPKPILESIISIYRNLRENYENRSRYEEADRFLVREIELRRMYKDEKIKSSVSDLELLETKLNDLNQKYESLKTRMHKLEVHSKKSSD